MMQVRLVTGDDAAEVTTTQIPPFVTPPVIILWGTRSFIYVGRETPEGEGAIATDVYREAFAYTLTDNPNT